MRANRDNENSLPAIGNVFVDNYEELGAGRDADTIAEVARCIRDFFAQHNAVLRRYEMGRYSFVVERKDLDHLLKSNFSLLDSVREIETPSGLPITLSIGVGIGDTLMQANAFAYQALDLAAGRGGDQAVVKRQNKFDFYGGKRQPGERYSRVKSRVFARALKQLMQQYDNILVMGHKMADYDAIGSAMGVFSCAKAIGADVSIVIDHANSMIAGILESAMKDPLFEGHIIFPEQAIDLCDRRTLLVITDTQRPSSIPLPELLDKAGAVSVIDHHRRGGNAIESTLQYIQVSASSTSELICEVIEYFSSDVKLQPLVATALLAGITVDTKHFSINTGARTFEAAAFLRRQGAVPSVVKALFQDDMDAYLLRAKLIQNAEFPFPSIAISVVDIDSKNAPLLAAQAADTFTTFREIQAAFVLYRDTINNSVGVSARSIGEINVQVILESLGGGGHLNVAGAQISGNDVEGTKQLIIQAIQKYLCTESPDLLKKPAEPAELTEESQQLEL